MEHFYRVQSVDGKKKRHPPYTAHLCEWPLCVPLLFFQEKMLPLPNDFSKLDNLLFNKPEPKQKMVEVKASQQ